MVRPSGIWRYFEYVDDKIAKCKTCNGTFSHSSSSTNLRKHLASKHPDIDLYQTRKYTKPIKYEIGIHRRGSSKINMTKRKSFIWLHYKVLNHSIAICKVCQKRISYKTSISNLKKHIIKRHPQVNLNESTNYDPNTFPESPELDMNMYDDDDNSFPDDVEDVRALLGLTGAQVEKTIEIIEELDNGNHFVYPNADSDEESDICDDNNDYDDVSDHYDDNHFLNTTHESSEEKAVDNSLNIVDDDHSKTTFWNDDFNRKIDINMSVLKNVTIKPALRRCLESIKKQTKPEPPPVYEEPRDPIDVLVDNMANNLKKLSRKQLLIAECKIEEILSLGLRDQLKHPYENQNYSHHQRHFPKSEMLLIEHQNGDFPKNEMPTFHNL